MFNYTLLFVFKHSFLYFFQIYCELYFEEDWVQDHHEICKQTGWSDNPEMNRSQHFHAKIEEKKTGFYYSVCFYLGQGDGQKIFTRKLST